MNPQILKDALAACLIKLADAIENPKPSYSVEGQSFSWGEYLKTLMDAFKAGLEILAMIEPFELRSSIL